MSHGNKVQMRIKPGDPVTVYNAAWRIQITVHKDLGNSAKYGLTCFRESAGASVLRTSQGWSHLDDVVVSMVYLRSRS